MSFQAGAKKNLNQNTTLYILKCDAGEYATDSILHLVWDFLSPTRTFSQGEGFRD